MKKKLFVFMAVLAFILVNFVSPELLMGTQPVYHEWTNHEQGCYTCEFFGGGQGAQFFCQEASGNFCFGYLNGQTWACVGGTCGI